MIELLPTRPDLDPSSIARYLVLEYIPGTCSPWLGINKLEPGTWLRLRSGSVELGRFWSPPLPVPDPSLDLDDACRELRVRVRAAVEARLESEVPVGVFLSGGIDSSVVVAEMVALGLRPATYAVGFTQGPYDETRWAAMVAEALGTDHHVLPLEANARAMFDDLSWAYDEPFADSSALATLAVAKAAKEHVTVVFTGDGGDELFGGYDRYRAMETAIRVRSALGGLSGPAATSISWAARRIGVERIENLMPFIRDPWPAYKAKRMQFPPVQAETLLRPELLGADPWAAERWLDERWDAGGGRSGRLPGSTRRPICLMTCSPRWIGQRWRGGGSAVPLPRSPSVGMGFHLASRLVGRSENRQEAGAPRLPRSPSVAHPFAVEERVQRAAHRVASNEPS